MLTAMQEDSYSGGREDVARAGSEHSLTQASLKFLCVWKIQDLNEKPELHRKSFSEQ